MSGAKPAIKPVNAIDLLEEDHKKMKKIMQEIDATTERGVKTREEMLAKMESELLVHERIEEEIFYPALKAHKKAKDFVLEAYEEHHAVNMLLEVLNGVPFDDETWGAKFTVIKENIEHHIKEEEEDLFKKARQNLSTEELEELGIAMRELKDELSQ